MRLSVAFGLLSILAMPSFAVSGVVSATDSDLAGISLAMDDILKDADSAKLKNVTLRKESEGWEVCGLVNAKNSYGAYAGYTPFIGMKFDRPEGKDIFVILSVDDSAGKLCGGHSK